MPSKILTHGVRWIAFAALATSLQLRAGETPSCADNPKITTFDAPHAGKGPGPTGCYNSCPGTEPYNNNAWGAVTGYYIDANNLYHGFVRSPEGTLTEFDAPGAGTTPGSGQGTLGLSINAQGAIAGQYQDGNNIYHGFVRQADGSFETFDTPDAGTNAFQGTVGQIINGLGEIAGYYLDDSNALHAFVRAPHGAITEFDAPGAGTGTFQGTLVAGPAGSGLNMLGTLSGLYYDASDAVHAYVRTLDGTVTTFDAPGAGTGEFQGTFGGGINLEGTIAAGYTDSNSVLHGYIRMADGNITTFEAPGAGNEPGFGSIAVANNNQGGITGYSVDNNNVGHGYFRFPRGGFKVFDVKGAGKAGGQGTTPWAINAGGEITGVYTDANNVNHGFVRGPDFSCGF